MVDPYLLLAIWRWSFAAYLEKLFAILNPDTAFQHNWHIDHICWQLERVARGEVKRLIICVPPRSLKSIMASVALPAWILGHDPTRRIICVSYADDLARTLSAQTRTVLTSPWHQQLFPQLQLSSRRPSTRELITTQHGYRLATGMGGSILGRGADLIIIDDPIKASDVVSAAERARVNDTFDNTLYTRLDSKKDGAIVIIMQRLHQDDLVGHVLQKDEWEVVSLPAIAEETRLYRVGHRPEAVYLRPAGQLLHEAREGREQLEQARRMQGSLTFAAQYQQAPAPAEGNIVRREWLRSYRAPPASFDFVIASWDTASTLSETADYSVGTVWGAKGLDYYLLDIDRGRHEAPTLRQRIRSLGQTWSVNQTIIEETELGRAIVQDLRRSGTANVILRQPRFDKEARFLAQSARFEAGQVYIPADAPWLAAWLDELLAFPNGRHDDQVDSTSQALDYLFSRTAPLFARQDVPQRPQSTLRPRGSRRREGRDI